MRHTFSSPNVRVYKRTTSRKFKEFNPSSRPPDLLIFFEKRLSVFFIIFLWAGLRSSEECEKKRLNLSSSLCFRLSYPSAVATNEYSRCMFLIYRTYTGVTVTLNTDLRTTTRCPFAFLQNTAIPESGITSYWSNLVNSRALLTQMKNAI